MNCFRFLLFCLVALFSLSCSEDKGTKPDTTPPASITDLHAHSTAEGLLYLQWRAPGDDDMSGSASQYDIRYAASDLAARWDSAFVMPSPPTPSVAGQMQSEAISSHIGGGTWQFGIKAADEASNWSALSNIARITIIAPDTIPPASVTDLRVESVTRGTVVLQWTAPGDDSLSGRAASYDLRYAMGTMTPETWADAIRVEGLSAPRATGETESFTVTGLAVGQEYAFALRVGDEGQNWSGMSNVATAFMSTFAPFQLTFNKTFYGAYDPNWSPDGSKIVFAMGVVMGPELTQPQLHVVAAGGGQPSQYTAFTPEGAYNPLWSRNGQRFYFLKNLTVQHIYTKSVLAVMDAVPGADYTILASYGLEAVGSLALSPDGSRIAYWVGNNTPGQPVSQAIYTNSTAGDDPHVLVSGIIVTGLDWSPDGTQLAYSMKQDGVYNLWVMPSSGGESTQITTGAEDKWRCAWSPDGSEIAYTSAGTIWAIPSSGGEPRRITTDSSDINWGIHDISWSPDGTKMAYEKYVGSIRNIWITPVD